MCGDDSSTELGKTYGIKSDIPTTLKQFFAKGGFSASKEIVASYMTKRFVKEDHSSIIPQIGDVSTKPFDIYPYQLFPNAYVVSTTESPGNLILVMKQVSNSWKIDNVIMPVSYDSFLDMNIINWDSELYYNY